MHKISFIAQDMTDSRAFGYIFGSPDTGHRFFGIKTDKAASQVNNEILNKTNIAIYFLGCHCYEGFISSSLCS